MNEWSPKRGRDVNTKDDSISSIPPDRSFGWFYTHGVMGFPEGLEFLFYFLQKQYDTGQQRTWTAV